MQKVQSLRGRFSWHIKLVAYLAAIGVPSAFGVPYGNPNWPCKIPHLLVLQQFAALDHIPHLCNLVTFRNARVRSSCCKFWVTAQAGKLRVYNTWQVTTGGVSLAVGVELQAVDPLLALHDAALDHGHDRL